MVSQGLSCVSLAAQLVGFSCDDCCCSLVSNVAHSQPGPGLARSELWLELGLVLELELELELELVLELGLSPGLRIGQVCRCTLALP